MTAFYRRWRAWWFSFCTLFLLVVLGLLAARLVFFVTHQPAGLHLGDPDLRAALWMGARFDLKHLSVLIGPWFLLSLVFYRAGSFGWQLFRRAFWLYGSVLVFLINLLSIINHYYFAFYQSPINALFFGLQEDDTEAILSTIWYDFPVLRLVLLLFAVTAVQMVAAKKVEWLSLYAKPRATAARPGRSVALISILTIALLAGLGRGSFGVFPLRAQHMNVSQNSFFNQLVPSGAHALHLAHKERSRSRLQGDPLLPLRQAGFEHWQEAAQSCGIAHDEGLFKTLQHHPQAEQQPPHVVVALMESWGRHLLEFDDPEHTDLLGDLRPWVQGKADFFGRALSIQNGTHPSLEGILLDTPFTPLMQSSHGYQTYDSARTLPYKEQGYKTIFLTAGSGSWRQLDPTLLRQGFDEIHDEQAIKERFPEAETHTWGIDDEWMFRYAEELLQAAERDGDKLMLFMLSVTNHPPYRTPTHYQNPSFELQPIRTAMATDEDMGQAIMQTYRYANHHLGQFLNRLEDEGLLQKTLVAATGDHTNRSIFVYPDSTQLQYKYGVPILFYIPPAYQQQHEPVDTQAWSSHQDIFPTLWAHSLSAIPVPISSGRNLYAPAQRDTALALSFIQEHNSRGISLSDEGAVIDPLSPTYLAWQESGRLQPTQNPSPALQQQAERTKACLALSDWRIRMQALATQK